MEHYNAVSLLHPKIAKFYQINQTCGDGNNLNCISPDCTYNWSVLEKLLLASSEWTSDDPVYPKTYAEYLSYFELLQPVLQQSETALSQSFEVTNCGNSIWFSKLQWLGHQTQMQTIFKQHLHPSAKTSTVENVLFLTAILENGLANVYYTITRKSPPHLLRDLLDTKELRDVFGLCPILFLKIIMGSPNSANIRNIVWHGFSLPFEIPSCYTATLLIAAASLFVLIEGKQLVLQARPQIRDFSQHVAKVKATSIDFSLLDDISKMIKAIDTSRWTSHSEHKAFWYQIIQHYQKEHYWQMIVLILPQIELLLRRMYGEANSFDITAKLEEYYITMDTIFESKDNRLLSGHLTKGTLHLLYDIFISPYGMRIRDKVSHGEVALNCISRDLCTVLLYTSVNLITSNDGYPLAHYRSQCHLNCLAHQWINASKDCVLRLMSIETPSSYELEFNWDQQSVAALRELKITRPEEIFDRHKKEPEIMSIVVKIAQLIEQVCENYESSFEERFRMLLKRELRSRGRRTLDQMVRSMTVVGVTLENIVQSMARLSNLMQANSNEWLDDKFENIQRFCKQTLTITENLIKFSDKGSNEWLNALTCCIMFQKVNTSFLIETRQASIES